jgi:hypothetical protein
MKPSVKIVACTIILITLLALSCGSPQSNETPVTYLKCNQLMPVKHRSQERRNGKTRALQRTRLTCCYNGKIP